MTFALRLFLLLTFLAVAAIEIAAWMQRHRQDLPWTELDLAASPGRFTAARIADLGSDAPRCRALLAAAGNRSRPAPDRIAGADCGYRDGTLVALDAAASPEGLVTSCPVAAAMSVWERQLQVEARARLGTRVTRLIHAGSFSCRRLYGRDQGSWSEHATADAVDILGFALADGRTVSVLRDWPDQGPRGAFLRSARDAACSAFTTVLSPDYNAAHRDHLHLDTADRGVGGWRACR
ncbi:extensin family protein [Sphingomonas astaxanthinifaciens]|uniref:Extensin n=1 Tax=Sphingomonas astaxanthinifaciens DSM 22298 TaxID=1123267 RepID=A0ABQ5Z5Y5_9SPHN|nr:extensin family protein [Sphingomonas astaxanthinifaciens]GLR47404.1 extensin [Sphingomonas astaxanthinifaciens DSM 22298]